MSPNALMLLMILPDEDRVFIHRLVKRQEINVALR